MRGRHREPDADLTLEVDGRIATVTFDRPAARNALDRRTRVALVDLLERLDRDPGVGVIMLTGTDPAFSSGVDAKEFLNDPAHAAPAVSPPERLRALDTPTIAVVNGACVSGALEIALACSFVIASERAAFADTHAKLGLMPGWGLSAELPATVGTARARQLTLTGAPIDAATALSWGLVNEVLPHEMLWERAGDLATGIVGLPGATVSAALRLYREGREDVLRVARTRESRVSASWSIPAGGPGNRFVS